MRSVEESPEFAVLRTSPDPDDRHFGAVVFQHSVDRVQLLVVIITSRPSHHSALDPASLINQIQRGWANYFKHAVAKHTFDRLQDFI